MKGKSEAILIRRRGGKLVEIKIIPPGKQAKTSFKTDIGIAGSMDTVSLEKYNDLIQWLESYGKLEEVERMFKTILRK